MRSTHPPCATTRRCRPTARARRAHSRAAAPAAPAARPGAAANCPGGSSRGPLDPRRTRRTRRSLAYDLLQPAYTDHAELPAPLQRQLAIAALLLQHGQPDLERDQITTTAALPGEVERLKVHLPRRVL